MATKKLRVKSVTFSKGITISKNYQAVKFELGASADIPEGMSLREARESLHEEIDRELRRLRDQATGGLHGLGE